MSTSIRNLISEALCHQVNLSNTNCETWLILCVDVNVQD